MAGADHAAERVILSHRRVAAVSRDLPRSQPPLTAPEPLGRGGKSFQSGSPRGYSDSRSIRSIAYATGIEKFLRDRKSTRLNSSHVAISYAVFCLKKKKN